MTEAVPRLPYGRSTHRTGYLTHLVGSVYVAWRQGVFQAMYVRWRCGGYTLRFRLTAEPDSTVCPACTIDRLPRPAG